MPVYTAFSALYHISSALPICRLLQRPSIIHGLKNSVLSAIMSQIFPFIKRESVLNNTMELLAVFHCAQLCFRTLRKEGMYEFFETSQYKSSTPER